MFILRAKDQIDLAERIGEHLCVTPIPPMLANIWEEAKGMGNPARDLYVLTRPLSVATDGNYEAQTGDIWVVFHPQDLERSAEALLHELAHAERQPPTPEPHIPATIDEDWDEEAATFTRAAELAQEMGCGAVIPPARLDAQLTDVEELRELHHAAAQLFGIIDPFLARSTYKALRLAAGRSIRAVACCLLHQTSSS